MRSTSHHNTYCSAEYHLVEVLEAVEGIEAGGAEGHRGAGPLGTTTFDIHLNDHAYWRNIPAAAWNYKLGGYQVLKKWLSYREQTVLGRPLLPSEVQHFAETARRIAAILIVTAQAQGALHSALTQI